MSPEIDLIRQALKAKLPGRVSQYKMAPSDRAIRDKALNTKELKQSAVLVLLFYIDKKLHLLLTQRAKYNGPHSGQISFPGGKFEATKDHNLLDTVIRETQEEIGLKKEDYQIIGELTSLNIPVSKTSVQSFVAFCSDISKSTADQIEVTDLYHIPIAHLLNPKNLKTKVNQTVSYPYYDFEGKVVWGATAMIISELLEIINTKAIAKN